MISRVDIKDYPLPCESEAPKNLSSQNQETGRPSNPSLKRPWNRVLSELSPSGRNAFAVIGQRINDLCRIPFT